MLKLSSSLRYTQQPIGTVGDVEIYLSGRFDDKERMFLASEDMYPYFYVDGVDTRTNFGFIDGKDVVGYEKTDLKAVNGNPVGKLVLRRMSDATNIGKKLNDIHVRTYERDLRYVRRLSIDSKFEIDYTNSWRYVDIETLDDQDYNLRAWGTIPIRSISMSDGKKNIWLCSDDYHKSGDIIEATKKGEEQMLNDFVKIIRKEKIGALYGWNVEFDVMHLMRRIQNVGISLKYPFSYLDMMEKYRFEVKGLGSYSLKEITDHEGMAEGKIHREKKIHKMTRNELEKYNRRDVDVLAVLDEKYGFSSLWNEIAHEVNMPLELLSAGNIGDHLILRRLRELGYVGVDLIERETPDYLGAYVKEPKSGLYRNVGVYDFSALYPNIIINNNIDIMNFDGLVVPYILKDMMSKRDNFKSMYDSTGEVQYDIKQKAMKPKINALYGLFGYKFARFYDKDKAEFVTTNGRKIILRLEKIIENDFGGIVRYADTDSVFIDLDSLEAVSMSDSIAEILNFKMSPYKLKLEYVFDQVIFPTSGKGSPKKRYVGRYWNKKKNKWDLVVRGLEMRRGDWCMLAKQVQKSIVNMIFDGNSRLDIVNYLDSVKKGLYSGDYDQKLIITKHIKKDGKVNTPQLRAFKMLEKLTKTKRYNNQVSYILTHNDVYPVDDDISLVYKPSYGRYWESQILPPAMRVLNVLEDLQQDKLTKFM